MSDYNGSRDAFVVKLNTNNGQLTWNTFIGGADGDDFGAGIVMDGGGNIYGQEKAVTPGAIRKTPIPRVVF